MGQSDGKLTEEFCHMGVLTQKKIMYTIRTSTNRGGSLFVNVRVVDANEVRRGFSPPRCPISRLEKRLQENQILNNQEQSTNSNKPFVHSFQSRNQSIRENQAYFTRSRELQQTLALHLSKTEQIGIRERNFHARMEVNRIRCHLPENIVF